MLTFAAARARGGSAQRALWLRPPPARCRAKSGASSAKGPWSKAEDEALIKLVSNGDLL